MVPIVVGVPGRPLLLPWRVPSCQEGRGVVGRLKKTLSAGKYYDQQAALALLLLLLVVAVLVVVVFGMVTCMAL